MVFPRRVFTPIAFSGLLIISSSYFWATDHSTFEAQTTKRTTTTTTTTTTSRQELDWIQQQPEPWSSFVSSSESSSSSQDDNDGMISTNRHHSNINTTITCHAASSCCARTVPPSYNPYFPYSRTRPTYEDRISPIDMKLIADVHFGSLRKPKEYAPHILQLTRWNLPCLLDGAVIFVDSVNVKRFVQTVLPKLAIQFVLVTGDSDFSMPGRVLTPKQVHALLQDERLLHWYAMNCDRNPNPQRFTCLPNGVSQWDNFQHQRPTLQEYYEQGLGLQGLDTSSISRLAANSENDKTLQHQHHQHRRKNITLFASFSVRNNKKERKPVWDMACLPDGLLYDRSTCAIGISVPTCYQFMTRSKFVLSPHGIGLDCYRTYESLYMGAFPIVKTSSLDEMFHDLPVLIVQNWTDLASEGFLERHYDEFMSRIDTFSWEKLYKGYWYAKFRSHYPVHRHYYETKVSSTTTSKWFLRTGF